MNTKIQKLIDEIESQNKKSPNPHNNFVIAHLKAAKGGSERAVTFIKTKEEKTAKTELAKKAIQNAKNKKEPRVKTSVKTPVKVTAKTAVKKLGKKTGKKKLLTTAKNSAKNIA